MTVAITLTIGPDLIDYATWKMCTLCPIAKELDRITGQPWVVYENEAVPLVRTGDKTYPRVRLPVQVADWIRRGDAGEPVEPIEFTVEIADSDVLSAA